MEKILEALGSLLPEDQVKQIAAAVEETLAETKTDLESEFAKKLEEAYADLSAELEQAEKTAEEGYKQAYSVIEDLRNRLETQRIEAEKAQEEGYEEAYQMLLAEKGKNEKLELEMYESYDKKLSEMKEYMVDKLDQFLQHKGLEIYEQARRDVLNDPNMVEHKITLDRIVETVADYISDEDFTLATSSKNEELAKQVEELKAQQRILEARNIRLSTENNKLNESLRHKEEVIVEHTAEKKAEEKKERVSKAKNVTGRGQITEGIIPEFSAEEKNDSKDKQADTRLVENIDPNFLHEMRILAGTAKTE